MTATEPPRLIAATGPAGKDIATAAAHALVDAVSQAGAAAWQIRLHIAGPDQPVPPGIAILCTMIDDVRSDVAIANIHASWLRRIADWRMAGAGRVLLCTLLRHVDDADHRAALIERIRRLNLMAIILSRSEGVEIVDLDRILARQGARVLATDYRCEGAAAAVVAARAIAEAILDGEMGDVLATGVQDRARQLLLAAPNLPSGMTQ